VYYHILGTEQSQDVLVYQDKSNPEYMFSTGITFDGDWVRMSISKDTSPTNKLWLAKLDGHALPKKGTFLSFLSILILRHQEMDQDQRRL
jgi:hypothetical protein